MHRVHHQGTRSEYIPVLARALLFVAFLHWGCRGIVAQDITVTPYARLPVTAEPVTLSFGSDGAYLLIGCKDGTVMVWDLYRKVRLAETRLSNEPVFLGLLQSEDTFVSVDRNGEITIKRLLNGQVTAQFDAGDRPEQVALDAGRRYLGVATRKKRIKLYDLKAHMPLGSIDARNAVHDVLFLGFDRLGKQLVAISSRGEVAAWNPATLRLLRSIELSGGELHGSRTKVHAAATNRAANLFAVGIQEVALPKGGLSGMARPGDLERRNLIIAFDWSTGMELKRVKYPGKAVVKIALGPGSDHVAVAEKDSDYITLVDLRKGELGSRITAGDKPTVLSVSEDNRYLAAGTESKQVVVWTLDFRDDLTAVASTSTDLPSLSGRIRALSGEAPALTDERETTLAILPFDDRGLSANVAALTGDLLASQLANVEHVRLVERSRIQDVLDELKLQMTGLTESDGAEVGRILNADYVLMGSIGKLGSSILFNARLLNVETAQIEKGRQVVCEECRDQDLFDAIRLLGATIAR